MTEHYLDNSATTRTDEAVAALALRMMTEEYGNPSSLHRKGYRAQLAMEEARGRVAAQLSADPECIIFTGGGTEANNLAVCGTALARRRSKGRMVVNAAEHASVLSAMAWAEEEGWEVVRVAPLPGGCPDIPALAAAVDKNTALVSCMAVNSETGAITDLAALAAAVRERSRVTLIHTDAVQGFCRLPLNPRRLGVDMLSLSGHKINAPKGVGALYLARDVRLAPLLHGSSQERGLHPGTESVPLICALGLAAHDMGRRREELWRKYLELGKKIITKLQQIDGICINSPLEGAPYILNLSVPGYRSETMIHFLEERGVYVSSGSACAKGAKSHVLTAMGLPADRIDSALRLSMGRYTTEEDLDAFVLALSSAMAQVRRR